MILNFGDSASAMATQNAITGLNTLALNTAGVYPGVYYPGGPGGVYPEGYYAPPGTVAGDVNANVPVIPVALGALAGWYWKKSPLAAIVGAIAGYILGNMIGSVNVQSQVQATPLQPSSEPYYR